VRLCEWSRRERRVIARQQERLGAIPLSDIAWKDAPADEIAHAMLDGVRELGLQPNGPSRLFLSRVRLVGAQHPLPDFSDTSLMEGIEDWLLPHLSGVRSAGDWKGFDLLPALRARLDWNQQQLVDTEAPGHFLTPLGRRIAIDYGGEAPAIALRLQEMFGQTRHPQVAGRPLVVTLLSPAGRPVQVTQDIPGFWTSSYPDVRKDMRGRYPRHPWPEDPREADPTLRVKRKGT
jgi:ATP-dependent helicase HrpB